MCFSNKRKRRPLLAETQSLEAEVGAYFCQCGAENDKNLRYFTVAGADAVGSLTDDGGMIVLKGSSICVETKILPRICRCAESGGR